MSLMRTPPPLLNGAYRRQTDRETVASSPAAKPGTL